MTNADRIKKAQLLAARVGGTLSIGIERNKLGKQQLSLVVSDLRVAADLLEEVIKC